MSAPAMLDGGFPIKIGDIEFTTTRLSERDWEDLDGWIQAKYLHKIRNYAKQLDDEDVYKEVMDVAVTNALAIVYGTTEARKIIRTDEGIIHLGYFLIKKRHSDKWSLEKFQKHCKKIGILQACDDILVGWLHWYGAAEEGSDGGTSTESSKSLEETESEQEGSLS